MKPLKEFHNPGVRFVFTDIDDTLTDEGQLGPDAYSALWTLKKSGLHVVPITGRPAGWCEMIARFWPVDGVVGENGGFYFRYIEKKMKRHFCFNDDVVANNRKRLDQLAKEILKAVPRAQIASDQFCRLMDLAVDFSEDVVPPLSKAEVDTIVSVFEKEGATAKVSSIHVNGWFGDYNKLSMCKTFLKNEFQIDFDSSNRLCAFVGDSPNDEPLFEAFENSFAVANVQPFLTWMKSQPQYVAPSKGGAGFVEVAERLSPRI